MFHLKHNDRPNPFSFAAKLDKAVGVDMHKDILQACMLVPEGGTSTARLKQLSKVLIDLGVSDIIIESTGINWAPLYELLSDQGVRVQIANPLRKTNPGQKKQTRLMPNGSVNCS